MKQLTNSKSNVAAAVVAVLTSTIFLLPRAVQYTHAARRDERKGFAYAAAMEWRHAAELFDPNTVPADYCWRQWERIIHLPRRLAGTICEAPFASRRLQVRNNTGAYDMPISTAA